MEVASSLPDYLPALSAAKTSNLSLPVKHHILTIDEASQQQQQVQNEGKTEYVLKSDKKTHQAHKRILEQSQRIYF